MRKNKRGLSGVIETILLILLVIIAAGILVAFLIPFVKNSLSSASACGIDSTTKVKMNPYYTCFYNLSGFTGMSVDVQTQDISIDKLLVVLSGQGESKKIELINGTALNDNLTMWNLPSSGRIELPQQNEEKTYRINFEYNQAVPLANIRYMYYMSKVERVKIAPIVNGKQCDGEEIDVQPCSFGA